MAAEQHEILPSAGIIARQASLDQGKGLSEDGLRCPTAECLLRRVTEVRGHLRNNGFSAHAIEHAITTLYRAAMPYVKGTKICQIKNRRAWAFKVAIRAAVKAAKRETAAMVRLAHPYKSRHREAWENAAKKTDAIGKTDGTDALTAEVFTQALNEVFEEFLDRREFPEYALDQAVTEVYGSVLPLLGVRKIPHPHNYLRTALKRAAGRAAKKDAPFEAFDPAKLLEAKTHEEAAFEELNFSRLESAMTQLTNRRRQAIELFFTLDNKTAAAKEMGVCFSTFNDHLNKGLEHLKDTLQHRPKGEVVGRIALSKRKEEYKQAVLQAREADAISSKKPSGKREDSELYKVFKEIAESDVPLWDVVRGLNLTDEERMMVASIVAPELVASRSGAAVLREDAAYHGRSCVKCRGM